MNDVQLLAHLLNLSGTELSSSRELAHVLLNAHRDLEHVLALSTKAMLRQPKLEEGAAAFLLLLPALIDRYTSAGSGQPIRLNRQQDLERLLWPHFYGQHTERVCAFFLDDRLRLISAVLVAQGDRATVSCSTRKVLELAVVHDAKGVVLAHNHPDGALAFSKSDMVATVAMARDLALVNVPLLDHFLLSGGQILSLRRFAKEQRGLGIPTYLLQVWFPGL